jgi:hypothetical protein
VWSPEAAGRRSERPSAHLVCASQSHEFG